MQPDLSSNRVTLVAGWRLDKGTQIEAEEPDRRQEAGALVSTRATPDHLDDLGQITSLVLKFVYSYLRSISLSTNIY